MKVPMASLEKSGESGPNPDDSRVFAIEACAVRVMKSRKTLTHQQLLLEVMAQLQFFKPTVKAIKKCFENLIDREYLERGEPSTSGARNAAKRVRSQLHARTLVRVRVSVRARVGSARALI